jgi:hypothetical protein
MTLFREPTDLFGQAKIFVRPKANALKIQIIESEIVNAESNNILIYLIKVNREEDIKEVIDFIQNDKSGLRLKPDWDYPDSKRNQSFELWLNE